MDVGHIVRAALIGAVSFVFLLVPAAPAAAQEEDAEVGRGFFQVGSFVMDVDELNADLRGAGYPSLNDTFLSLGGAGFGERGRFLIGGEGHALLGGDETSVDGTYRISAGGGYGLFRVGYVVLSSEGFDVFPMIGIGGGGMGLKIAERSVPTFDDVLDNPARSSSLSTGMFLIDTSIGANYRAGLGGEAEGGFLVGVQVGYTFAPGDPKWELDEINTVAGGPPFKIEGPYIRLSLGGWGSEEPEEG